MKAITRLRDLTESGQEFRGQAFSYVAEYSVITRVYLVITFEFFPWSPYSRAISYPHPLCSLPGKNTQALHSSITTTVCANLTLSRQETLYGSGQTNTSTGAILVHSSSQGKIALSGEAALIIQSSLYCKRTIGLSFFLFRIQNNN